MTSATEAGPTTGFVHQACVYDDDARFLAMAVPFIADGLARGEPVLLASTPANLELVADALGPSADRVDYVDTTYFGRTPARRIAAFHRYRTRQASDGRVRMIAEPVWTGRSRRDVTAWTRMESTLNVALADRDIWMICPYDTRVVPAHIVADAHRTHPATNADGRVPVPSPDFVDPSNFVRARSVAPLPEPPPGTAAYHLADGLPGLRAFVRARAAALGLTGERAALLVGAAGEVVGHLASRGVEATVRMWRRPDTIVCDVHRPGASLDDPFCGFRPIDSARAAAGDGMWVARQVCDTVDLCETESGTTIRLSVSVLAETVYDPPLSAMG